MPWTKVKTKGQVGATQITTPRVRRSRSGRVAQVVLPEAFVAGWSRFDVYENGDQIAFSENPKGDYSVRAPGPKARAKALTIPSPFVDRFSYGTVEVELSSEGGMLVLDMPPRQVKSEPRAPLAFAAPI